jgi:hypothetical protein
MQALGRLLGIFGVTALMGAGCAGNSSTPTPGPGTGGESGAFSGDVSCSDDARVDTYTAKLSKLGANGALDFELTESEPAPPAKGANTWTLTVTDLDGNALDGTLAVELVMPDHGHGTSVPPVVSFDEASGSYTVNPVYLFMPGVWRITVEYYGPADEKPVDSAAFYFCIAG